MDSDLNISSTTLSETTRSQKVQILAKQFDFYPAHFRSV